MRRWQVFVVGLFVAAVACTGSDDAADTEQTVDTSMLAESQETESAETEATVDTSMVAESQETESAETEPTVDTSMVAESQETAETVVDRTGALSCLPMDPDGWTQASAPFERLAATVQWAANDETIVALGAAQDVDPRFSEVVMYHSSDGVVWEPGEGLPEVDWEPFGPWPIAGSPNGFVAVGAAGSWGEKVPMVAFSADGASWERIDPEDLPESEVSELTEVFAGPEGFVILGYGVPYIDPDLGPAPGGPLLWHSDDGRSWTAGELLSDWGPAVAATETGWAALTIRDGSLVQVWTSSDGLRWSEVETDTRPTVLGHAGYTEAGPLVVFDDTWVHAPDGAPEDDPSSYAVWVSTNGGVSWAEQTVWSDPESPGVGIFDMVMTDQGLILSGTLWEQPELGARFVHHSDDGITWQHCFTRPLDLRSIAAFGDGVVAYDAESGDVFTWQQP